MSNRRLVVYLILGSVLCVGGVVAVVLGAVTRSLPTQFSGLVMYAVSILLLFEAKFEKTEYRIRELESRLRRHWLRHRIQKPESDEEEPDEPREGPPPAESDS